MERVWADCSSADPAVYQLVLSWEDGSLVSLTPRGNTMFLREEGLASIHTAQMVVRAVQEDSQAGANRAEYLFFYFLSLGIIHNNRQCCGSGSGIRCLFNPGIGKKSRSESGMNIPDHIFESLETIFWVKNTEIL